MALGSGMFNPVKLPADETEIIRKRESLRSRGLGWAAFAWWIVALTVAGLCIPLASAGLRVVALDLVNGLLIVLSVVAPLLLFFVFLVWWSGSYTIGPQRVCRAGDFSAPLRSLGSSGSLPASSSVECLDVTRVAVERLPWPAHWFDVGHVIITTRTQARALVLPYMQHPTAVAEEIMRYSLGNGQSAQEPAGRRLHRSVVWLAFWEGLGLTFLWACVAAWAGLSLLETTTPATLASWLGIAGLLTALIPLPLVIDSFLRWWYTVYVVTDRRVISRVGLFNVTERVLSLEDVVSASVTKFGLARYLGMGNVQISTAGRTGDVRMRNISEADFVRQRVLEAQESVRQGRQQLEFGEISRRLTHTLHLY